MSDDLLAALALLLVIEGILPFLSPELMRRAWLNLVRLDDRTLRFGGLTAMILGVLMLQFLR